MNKCPKCDSTLSTEIVNQEVLITCPNCGTLYVTAINAEYEFDLTKYTIYVESQDDSDVNKIKCIAKIINSNLLEAKKGLKEGFAILTDYATHIIIIKKILEENNIKYYINPDFKY